MADGERRSVFSDRSRNGRVYKSSPLLNSVRKYQASEKSSLSESFEAPKCYGTTRNPLQPQCEVKLIGHILEATDTLQGLAIKYGVTVEQLRRVNKIWANDNIHLFKILKVPVKKDSQHHMSELEVSDDESGTDNSGIYVDRTSNNVVMGKQEKQSSMLDGALEKSKDADLGSSEEKQNNQTPLSFLEQLDARIKSSKQQSEKLRTVSGPRVIADVEKLKASNVAADDLFQPLEIMSSRRQRGQILTSNRHTKRDQTLLNSDDHFFEL